MRLFLGASFSLSLSHFALLFFFVFWDFGINQRKEKEKREKYQLIKQASLNLPRKKMVES